VLLLDDEIWLVVDERTDDVVKVMKLELDRVEEIVLLIEEDRLVLVRDVAGIWVESELEEDTEIVELIVVDGMLELLDVCEELDSCEELEGELELATKTTAELELVTDGTELEEVPTTLEELELTEAAEEDEDRLELELRTVDDNTVEEDKVVLTRDETNDEILEDAELVKEIWDELTDEDDAETVIFW
jgi:hypothetical protein